MSAEEIYFDLRIKNILPPLDAIHKRHFIELLEKELNIKAREAAEKAYNACLESIYQDPTADVEVSKQAYLNTSYPIK